MERKFYPEDFERFLKHQADQFKMSPSKKAWHGIYNDLHPGRRWPSVTMSLMLIFTFVVISHLNTNNEHNKYLAVSTLSDNLNNAATNSKKSAKIKVKHINQNPVDQNNIITTANNNNSISFNEKLSSTTDLSKKKYDTKSATAYAKNFPDNSSYNNTDLADKNISPIVDNFNNDALSASVSNTNGEDNSSEINETILKNNIPNQQINSFIKQNLKSKIAGKAVIKNVKVRKSILNWTYYVMPSFSYRNLSSAEINNSVFHKPVIGVETGTHLTYRLSNKLQFTTGLQLDYSAYNIKSSNVHPTVASLVLNSEFAGQTYTYTAMSNYGNTPGSHNTKLKNYSIQASLPVGLLYNFAGNDKIKFNAEATFQPTYVITGKAYMLSTDQKNYLTAPDLLRRWNMSTNFGTFISFRSNAFSWEIGPEIHYQLLSTYTKKYPFAEHLVNYGVHLGVSKILK